MEQLMMLLFLMQEPKNKRRGGRVCGHLARLNFDSQDGDARESQTEETGGRSREVWKVGKATRTRARAAPTNFRPFQSDFSSLRVNQKKRRFWADVCEIKSFLKNALHK